MNVFQELLRPEMSVWRYALIIGALSSVSLGIVGTMVVTRRISSLAGAASHAARAESASRCSCSRCCCRGLLRCSAR